MYTTLNEIKKHDPCTESWEKGMKWLGKTKADNRKLSFKRILKAVGIVDAVWCLRVLPYEDCCLFMADVAESVLHIFEKRHPDDDRPRKAIQAVRDYKAKGISSEELAEARHAAYAAYAAYAAAADAAAADAAAADAAAYAAYAAYAAAADAAYAAYAAAADAAYAAAADAARKKKWQEIERLFIKHFC